MFGHQLLEQNGILLHLEEHQLLGRVGRLDLSRKLQTCNPWLGYFALFLYIIALAGRDRRVSVAPTLGGGEPANCFSLVQSAADTLGVTPTLKRLGVFGGGGGTAAG